MDYSTGEILPLTLLREPAVADEYGDPLSHHYTTVPGLAVTPVGLRMLWRDGKVLKPYFTVKGGVVGYTQKALSPDGAYLNFTLQETVGTELRLTHAWEIRLGAGDFHFSMPLGARQPRHRRDDVYRRSQLPPSQQENGRLIDATRCGGSKNIPTIGPLNRRSLDFASLRSGQVGNLTRRRDAWLSSQRQVGGCPPPDLSILGTPWVDGPDLDFGSLKP